MTTYKQYTYTYRGFKFVIDSTPVGYHSAKEWYLKSCDGPCYLSEREADIQVKTRCLAKQRTQEAIDRAIANYAEFITKLQRN